MVRETHIDFHYDKTESTSYTSSYTSLAGYDEDNWLIINGEDVVLTKKLLKRMMDDMCKSGWIQYIPYYRKRELKPISLRGVRYDGRGWAN